MTLEEKIKLIRETIRMSQREFAHEIGCSQGVISAYETGRKRPSYENLILIDQIAKKHKVKVKLI